MPDEIRHPVFARFFDRLSRMVDDVGPYRDELLTGLTGRVLALGAGNGISFSHYPASVAEVVAIEPEPYLRAKAQQAAESALVPVKVLAGVADHLELDDDGFDAAVTCLVLCSVPDQARALRELRRVMKPGAELRFLEHVRATGSAKVRVQTLADRSGIWPNLFGGCHCGRDTTAAVEAAGFRIAHLKRFDLGPSVILTNPHVLGRAVR